MEIKYIEHLASLVRKEERISEAQTSNLLKGSMKERVKRGVAIVDMVVSAEESLVPGTIILKFVKKTVNKNGKLISIGRHRIEKGDMVSIQIDSNTQKNKKVQEVLSGVVYYIFPETLGIAFTERYIKDVALFNDVIEGSRCEIVKSGNSVTFKKMLNALTEVAERHKKGQSSPLTKTLLGMKEPAAPPESSDEINFFDSSLNESQKNAVRFTLVSSDISLIHGPPGTGKTHTLIEIIRQLVINHKKKVLVCGPSHVAVDNLLHRTAEYKEIKVVRIGEPARVSPLSLKHTLSLIAAVGNSKYLEKEATRMISALHYKVKTTTQINERKETEKTMKQLNRLFKTKASARYKVRKVLNNANVVFSTLVGAGGSDLINRKFDVVIIDEAAQATEPECWIALLRGEKAILAGDHLQLPPTVLTQANKINGEVAHVKGMSTRNNLSYTLFDRLLDTHGDNIKEMLLIQYRMHKKIMEFSSNQLYENKLIAHKSVEAHSLSDLKTVVKRRDTDVPIIAIDTSDSGKKHESVFKSSLDSNKSIANDFEIKLVSAHIIKLLSQGVKQAEIGVITPYAAQVKKLNMIVVPKWPDIEVRTVDGFQGREKEAIILSLVRSNPLGVVGFVSDKRRLNVAMTRARRHLTIVCDMETMTSTTKTKTKKKNAAKETKGVKEKKDGNNTAFLNNWMKWLKTEAVVKGSKKSI